MPPVDSAPEAKDRLSEEVTRLTSKLAFGRSAHLRQLFEFLVLRSSAAAPPKEIEIARAVFAGKNVAVDDGAVRVYVHRLRKRLDDFYLHNKTASDGLRLVIPKGEYRLVLLPTEAAAQDTSDDLDLPAIVSFWQQGGLPWRTLLIGLFSLALLNAGMWWLAWPRDGQALSEVRRDAVWKPLLTNHRPIVIVVGDYYMFGDYEGSLDVQRLVRDFKINSKDDLLDYLMTHPKDQSRYADVGQYYLPMSTAYALKQIVPILPSGEAVHIIPASETTPKLLQDRNVIYVGLISGLGPIQESVFKNARFITGTDFDSLVDTRTKAQFLTVNPMSETGKDHVDYGLLSSFSGPSGNRILIIAGTRDGGLVGLSDLVSRPTNAAQLRLNTAEPGFEAVFKVAAQNGLSRPGTLVASTSRDGTGLW